MLVYVLVLTKILASLFSYVISMEKEKDISSPVNNNNMADITNSLSQLTQGLTEVLSHISNATSPFSSARSTGFTSSSINDKAQYMKFIQALQLPEEEKLRGREFEKNCNEFAVVFCFD